MISAWRQDYWLLMRFHKPIGTLLLLWPTLWAMLLASHGKPPVRMVIIFVLGVIIMRAAGCVINDIADKDFDKWVARTATRPLTSGLLTVRQAYILFAWLCVAGFGLVLFLNIFAMLLAVPALLLAISYPFMKRIMPLPQLILGVAFSCGIPMAFAALQNEVPWYGWLLMLANIFWTVAYDTEYAMVDRNDDVKIGIQSSAILFGSYDRLIIGILQLSMLILLVAIGFIVGMHKWYYVSLGLALLLMIYQQKLIYERKPAECLQAFQNNGWVGLIITLGILSF